MSFFHVPCLFLSFSLFLESIVRFVSLIAPSDIAIGHVGNHGHQGGGDDENNVTENLGPIFCSLHNYNDESSPPPGGKSQDIMPSAHTGEGGSSIANIVGYCLS